MNGADDPYSRITCTFAVRSLFYLSNSRTDTTPCQCAILGFVVRWFSRVEFYVVYDRKKWALYMPAAAIIVNALLGFSGDFQHLSYYHSTSEYLTAFKLNALKINAAWGWFTFGINTVLSGAIIGKIMCVSTGGLCGSTG